MMALRKEEVTPRKVWVACWKDENPIWNPQTKEKDLAVLAGWEQSETEASYNVWLW